MFSILSLRERQHFPPGAVWLESELRKNSHADTVSMTEASLSVLLRSLQNLIFSFQALKIFVLNFAIQNIFLVKNQILKLLPCPQETEILYADK